jgi:thiol-disulfide isomerase/thioredoxin
MHELFKNQRFAKVFNFFWDWIKVGAIITILYYTGIMSTFAYYAQTAVIKSGLKNASIDKAVQDKKKINYDFSLYQVDGSPVSFAAFKGKVVFLNIWATWCGPCRAEMDEIQALYNTIDHEKIAFVLLSVDRGENKLQKISSYFKSEGYNMPVYLPGPDIPEALKVSTIPTTYVIDAEGGIVFTKSGSANYNTKRFKKFLNELSLADHAK